ncbi:type II toxin-antitoxin system VapC family toxin [Methylovirgula sp. 4M-Z18]|uniref:type II toxin-antitoxin system VapC family toxin n=1 Tax=Methylovirgula sp. 4M-Z18 TaxID=2293567 RepID=UPI000E2F0A29|nr:type II toxin-antitoxin system VapC family toxin [Methylovirgula sp. 4M-Z18]RFB78147.1 PIN domain-containing protein [Methylovirgula sp. 4M-Z18]
MTSLVVDASVAYHWFAKEAWSDEANNLLRAKPDIAAPDLILAEIANVVWKKLRRGEITDDQAEDAVVELRRFVSELVPVAQIIRPAFALACSLNHSVYDCLYLELARQRNDPFVTLDEALIAKVTRARVKISILHLSDWKP